MANPVAAEAASFALLAVPLPPADGWRDDIFLAIVLLLLFAALYLSPWSKRASTGKKIGLAAGLALVGLALSSPLVELRGHLFALNALQQVLVAFVAAPLLGYGLAGTFGAVRKKSAAPLITAPTAAAVFAFTLWFWHLDLTYGPSLQSATVYWFMQVTVLASAVALWLTLFHKLAEDGSGDAFAFAAASIGTGLQVALLGTLLAFSGQPWFTASYATAPSWGLTALEDQQLGGVILWLAGGVMLSAFVMYSFSVGLPRLKKDLKDIGRVDPKISSSALRIARYAGSAKALRKTLRKKHVAVKPRPSALMHRVPPRA